LVGPSLKLKGILDRHLKRKVAWRPRIGSRETEQDIDVGCPWADAFQRGEPSVDDILGLFRQGVEIERACVDGLSEPAQCEILIFDKSAARKSCSGVVRNLLGVNGSTAASRRSQIASALATESC
jgi:hypothetical protein